MSVYLQRGGLYLGVEPSYPEMVYADRQSRGAWEEVELTPHEDGLVAVRFIAADRHLTILPDGRLETRPAGAWGVWEQLTLVTQPGGQVTVERAGTVLVVEGYTPIAPAGPFHLEVRGRDFVDADGQRIALCGCDGFMDYRIWLDQKEDGLDPFMAEATGLGFDVRRVFLQGSKSQNQVLELVPAKEPQWRAQLRPFVTYENAHGIIPLLTFCIDNQIVKSDLRDLWTAAHAELAGLAYLASYGNELDKNGGNPSDCPTPPPGVIWSRGSKTQDDYYKPNGATAAEFHPVRDFNRCLMDAVASAVFMQDNGCSMIWMDEGIPFDDGSNPFEAWQLGRVYATCWALAILHNRQGQRGQLLKPGTRRCAEQWVRGMGR